MRLFVAAKIPPEIGRGVGELLHALKQLPGKRVEQENIHLTLAFLGDVPDAAVPALERELEQAVKKVSSFAVRLDELTGIPKRKPRVLALRVTVPLPWGKLQQLIIGAAKKFKINATGFGAHLTLVRLKAEVRSLPAVTWKPQAFVIHNIILFKSTLRPQGPLYTPVKAFKLAAGGAEAPLRPNIAICVVNPKNEVLLVRHSLHKTVNWMFPQGGIEKGETLTQAGLRELKEELGIVQGKVLGVYGKIYEYWWPMRFQGRGIEHAKEGYLGQEQSLIIIRVPTDRPQVKLDPQELAHVKWVPVTSVLESLHPVRRDLGRLAVVELRKLGIMPK